MRHQRYRRLSTRSGSLVKTSCASDRSRLEAAFITHALAIQIHSSKSGVLNMHWHYSINVNNSSDKAIESMEMRTLDELRCRVVKRFVRSALSHFCMEMIGLVGLHCFHVITRRFLRSSIRCKSIASTWTNAKTSTDVHHGQRVGKSR